jgi:hypothetical protein
MEAWKADVIWPVPEGPSGDDWDQADPRPGYPEGPWR